MKPVTLVLLPGLDGTGRLFAPLLPMLPSWLTPLVIPYPDDTFLDYAALHDYVRQRLPTDQPFVLLGESFAGPLAVSIAATRPSNLTALVLCATFVTNPTIVPRWLGRLIFNPFLFSITPPDLIARWFLVGRGAPSQLVRQVQEVIASAPPALMAARTREVLRCDARASLRNCTLPILYLRGTDDRIVRGRSLREILAGQPDAVVETLDAPHFLLQREPAVASRIIATFLERVIKR